MGGEEEGVPFGLGETLDLKEDDGDLLGMAEGGVGGEVVGDEVGGEVGVHLTGLDAAAAVEGQVPDDADEPDAEVSNGDERLAMLDDAEEGFLDDVLGLLRAAENGERHTEEER